MNWKKILVICISLLILPSATFADLNDDLEAYYPFNSTSGTTLVDVTGNGHDGDRDTAVLGETGIITDAYGYTTGCSNIPDFSGLDGDADGLSVQIWANWDDTGSGYDVMLDRLSGSEGWALYIHSGKIAFTGRTPGGSFETENAFFTHTGGQWYHLVGVWDGDDAKLYIDGVLNDTDTRGSGAIVDRAAALDMAKRSVYTVACGAFGDGRMDELGIWSRALNSSEVSELYNSGAGFAYPFSYGEDPTITNISNQVVVEDSITEFTSLFTIADPDTDIADLTLSYVSSNTTLINNSDGLTFAKSDTTGIVNVTVTPEGDLYGVTNITITVTDPEALTAESSFSITVTNVNDGPVISVISDVNTLTGATAIAPFTVLDIDNDYTDLSYTATSNNAALFTSTNFSNSDGTDQNFTMVLATYGQAIVNVTVSDLEPLSDSTTFTVTAYCNTSAAPYTDTNAVDAPPTCYDVTGSFDEDTDIFTYTWIDYGNSTENNYIEIYRTSAGSWDLIVEEASPNNSGSFEVNLSAYPNDNFQIRGFMTDQSRTFIDGEIHQRVYMDNIDQGLNLPEAWKQSDGIIWSVLIITLFLTIGIASQSATLTLILSIFGLFFATNMVLNVPAQFLWTAGVVVAILIGLIAKLRID